MPSPLVTISGSRITTCDSVVIRWVGSSYSSFVSWTDRHVVFGSFGVPLLSRMTTLGSKRTCLTLRASPSAPALKPSGWFRSMIGRSLVITSGFSCHHARL